NFASSKVKRRWLTYGPSVRLWKNSLRKQSIYWQPPSTEKSCPIGQTILVYRGKPGQGRCITENDAEFRQNYIDNYIVQADALAIPNTTWENVDHDRVPQIQLTYKDGRALVVDVKDIPRGKSFRKLKTTGATRSLARYEKR